MSELRIEQPEQLKAEQIYYRAQVRQLTSTDSTGVDRIFVDIIGLDDSRQSQERFVIFTNNQESANIAPDKPTSETYGADVPMFTGNTYGFRPWTFIGDNVWGFEPGQSFELRWVAEQIQFDGPPSLTPSTTASTTTTSTTTTSTTTTSQSTTKVSDTSEMQLSPTSDVANTEYLLTQIEQTTQRLETISSQMNTMQTELNQAITTLQELKQQLNQ